MEGLFPEGLHRGINCCLSDSPLIVCYLAGLLKGPCQTSCAGFQGLEVGGNSTPVHRAQATSEVLKRVWIAQGSKTTEDLMQNLVELGNVNKHLQAAELLLGLAGASRCAGVLLSPWAEAT